MFLSSLQQFSLFTVFIFQEYKINSIGGYDVNDHIWRIMKCLFSNALGKQMNWSGKNEKISLGQLHLMKLIFGKLIMLLAIMFNFFMNRFTCLVFIAKCAIFL